MIMNKIKRILVVEDTPEWQKFHINLLKNYFKNEVELTVNSFAREGYQSVLNNLNNPFDLIISDLQMETDFEPEFAGEWFIKQVKNLSEYKNVPVVIMSATYNIAFIAHNLGVEYLSKRSLISNPDSYIYFLDQIFV